MIHATPCSSISICEETVAAIDLSITPHHTQQAFSLNIGWPSLHETRRGWPKLTQNALPGAFRKIAHHEEDPHAHEQKKRGCVDEKPKRSGRSVLDLDVDQFALHCRHGVSVIRRQNGSHGLAVL